MQNFPRSLASFLCTVAFFTAAGEVGSRPARAQRMEEILARMTLEEKVGQMVMAGIEGYEPGEDARWLIEEGLVGGIILFSRNVQSPGQVRRLVGELQSMAGAHGARIPLLIAADQEGGIVVRFQQATVFPGNMALGAAHDPELAYRAARRMAEEMRAMGVTVNFAPVVDVNNNPDNPVIGVRSFGEEPEAVGKLGAAMVRGFQDGGVVATAKHFPGHGDTGVDSHIALPTITHSRQRLDRVELAPFRAAIEAGVQAIMTADITFPAIDPTPGLPATLSRPVLTGLLRNELGFDGLIFTDAMEMGAIADHFGTEEAAVRSVLAGADVVLVGWPKDWHLAAETVQALVKAARDGVISEARLDASVRRVLRVKERLGLLEGGAPRVSDLHVVGDRSGQELALEVARASVTLVQNDGVLPLSQASGRILVITPSVQALTAAENDPEAKTTLGRSLRRFHADLEEIVISLQPDAKEIESALRRARQSDTIVVGTHRAAVSRGQTDLVNALIDLGKPVVAVALREPYDLSRFPRVNAFVATYSYTPASIEALGEVLYGRIAPSGRLPVGIPGWYEAGHGLTY